VLPPSLISALTVSSHLPRRQRGCNLLSLYTTIDSIRAFLKRNSTNALIASSRNLRAIKSTRFASRTPRTRTCSPKSLPLLKSQSSAEAFIAQLQSSARGVTAMMIELANVKAALASWIWSTVSLAQTTKSTPTIVKEVERSSYEARFSTRGIPSTNAIAAALVARIAVTVSLREAARFH
jgi:hypothetical protein